ncbi:hypothetical protein KSF78_0008978, partial [Schistosoma japonicum]
FIQHCHEDDCIHDNCYSIDSNLSLWIIQQQRLTEKIVKMLRPDGELFNNIHHRVTIQFLFNFEYYIGVYGQVLSKYSIKLIQ